MPGQEVNMAHKSVSALPLSRNDVASLAHIFQVALSYGRKEGGQGSSRGMGLRIIAYETKEDHPLLLIDSERVMH